MSTEHNQSHEVDLDKTDRLPIIDGTLFDHDVEDDAVRMDHTADLSGPSLVAPASTPPDFVRFSGVDLPSLAESVRSVEERIARLNAEHEDLARAYERAQDAESSAVARANSLAVDLAANRTALATRDATIVQMLQSLGDRDAQLAALQSEHAKIVPELEATTKSGAQLAAELQSTRAHLNALAQELNASRGTEAALAEKLNHGEAEANSTRTLLSAVKTQAISYLELLRTREWRRGFDLNMFREMDARVGAADAGRGALEAERDRLASQVTGLEAQLAAQRADAEQAQARLSAELETRDHTIAEIRAAASGDAQRIARLQSAAETQEQEMTVLMAHLQEARRPIQSIEADVRRLTEELAAKSAAFEALDEESRKLQASLERARGALEEREFLIRRLERSESNNANALGRIQTSIERLGSGAVGASTGSGANVSTAAGSIPEWSAELIRIDGERPVTHVLSRRTRIGRAVGCELQIDSTSVSRHHALVLVGPRETIIEDLNSTNGVLVNGRKVTRQLLCHGDAVTLGEIQFQYFARQGHRPAEPATAEPAP
jgi:septal ring factor EnvC (AmiA/AmiB activator)